VYTRIAVRRAYVFRLYPTKQQAAALAEALDTHRYLYNRALAERKAAWETDERTLTYGEQSAALKTQRTEHPYLARANFSACQRTLRRLDRAFAGFIRRVKAGERPGHPRFKGGHRFATVEYTHADGCRFFGRGTPGATSLYVQRVGRVKVKQHRPTEGTIKSVSVTRRADGWHAVVVCDLGERAVASKEGPAVGIDLGLRAFLATSEGETVAPPRYRRQAQAALRRAQRAVARRAKGGARRRKAVKRVRRLHLHVASQRRDFHHKTARWLVRAYGTVCHERLNVTGLARSRLAKSTLDAGWGGFLTILRRKAAEAGVAVVAVPPFHTSQACPACGALPATPKTLRERVHACPCGYTADRDVNAARNVLLLGTGNRLGPGRQAPSPTAVGLA
jgi:putative transposase